MKNHIYSVIALFLMSNSIFGQDPNWSVNQNNYQYTMTFVGFLNSDGIGLVSPNDKVAAFVNGECRGITNVIYVASEKRHYAYLTVFSNVNNETISFKIYDSGKNAVKSINKTIPFKTNEQYGDLFQAYAFASPALQSGAQMLDVSFKDIISNNVVIEGSQITVYLNKGQDITALNANFVISSGASVYLGNAKQISGANALNYTNPVVFTVLSEDQTTVKQWTVVVKTVTASYYKKEAVCYEGGAIKVLFPVEKEEVVLSIEGVILSTRTVNNGEVIFNNLNEGNYKVSVDGNFKEIKINLKKSL
ncbi:hypothetical protein BST83_17545 [Polaribacter filamentus]|uniref:Secretion system C-terminal sorting domain-containing protein n=1 Tax=Polaribacter filamentus TaxID=53483 RepID=A0A2S7KKK2_9FLAO|nr:hypothetical protein [Polaribacter filamentus]PQB03130.1 hypothetical protein BST83_17545 [Polaribacter filamentus]